MVAQLDLPQLSRGAARRVTRIRATAPDAVHAHPDTGSVIAAAHRDRPGVLHDDVHDVLRTPARAGWARRIHLTGLSAGDGDPAARGDAPAARPTPDRHRHPGRKSHVPDA